MMRRYRHPLRLRALVCVLSAVGSGSAWAAGIVQLEIVTESRTALTASQTWMRALGRAGIQNVRIRQARSTDKIGIQVRGTERSPIYAVTGKLTSAGELHLPGARFRQGEAARLARWIDELASQGPVEGRPQRSAFGLTAEQYQQVRSNLAFPVSFSTKGVARRDALQRIGRGLRNPLQLDPRAVEAVGEDPLAEELAGLSSGTAIACVLRPAGYCMVPRASGGRVVLAVVRAQAGLEIWPIGWKPEKNNREVLPALYEFLSVNIQGVPVSKALEAVAGRLKVPYLMDHNALARHAIDPAKSIASLPKSRTFYSKALQRILFPAGLKSELRVDEADRPFLWITSVKPM